LVVHDLFFTSLTIRSRTLIDKRRENRREKRREGNGREEKRREENIEICFALKVPRQRTLIRLVEVYLKED
jgi:hypothetical protein